MISFDRVSQSSTPVSHGSTTPPPGAVRHATIITSGEKGHGRCEVSLNNDENYSEHASQNALDQKKTGKTESKDKIHILLAVTGSVATIKIPLIIDKLKQVYKDKAEMQLIVTTSAEHFMKGLKIPSDVRVWHDGDEWNSRKGVPDTMLHVRLRRWADILLIAPLSANTLAKIANGICNNLVTSVIRSWNPAVPILIAPAMNTHMYTNPMTKRHLTIIREDFPWVHTLKPIEKVLVCGDIGMGGMREWTDIVAHLIKQLGFAEEEDDDDDDCEGGTEDVCETAESSGSSESSELENERDNTLQTANESPTIQPQVNVNAV